MTYNKRNRTVLGLSLAAATIALGACGGGDSSSETSGASEKPTSQETSESSDSSTEGEPDLAGIPDVVAEVNGEELTKDEFVVIYRAQFQQATMQAQAGGEAPDEDALKEQAADNLVDTELLVQEAGDRGFDATDDEVDSELDKLAQQNQMKDGAELIAALEEQGTTEEQARDQLEQQVVIQELVTDEAGTTEPTEKELRAIYDQAKQQAGTQELPPYAQVKDQIVEQARTDKLDEVAQALVKDLRKDADITINL
jgi:peptidyl-prolyl cis-trans isomerase SurA